MAKHRRRVIAELSSNEGTPEEILREMTSRLEGRANAVALWGKYARTGVDVGKLELRPHRSLRHTKLDSYKPVSLVKDVLEKKQTTADLGSGRGQLDLMPGFGLV